VRTPGVIANRPGLPEIAYRSGTHGDFLASLLAGLSGKDVPTLSALRSHDGDDPTIALIDAWAVACDVLTFYTERLANESYLRTATDRTSLQELGKLIGYRLNPGVAAETYLAVTLQRPPATPPGAPRDPGLLPPAVPAATVVPVGLRVQSIPGPGEQPQTFETVEAIEARPEWNVLPLASTAPYPPIFGRTDAWFTGAALNLHRGDAILFASTDLIHDKWDLRLLTSVTVDTAGDRTHVLWDRGLGSSSPFNNPAAAPDTFVLRKRFSVFGHNAPLWTSTNIDFQAGYVKTFPFPAGGDHSEWPSYSAVTWTGPGTATLDLDGSHPDVVPGSWVVVSQESVDPYRELYLVKAADEVSRSAFAVSGPVTRLSLAGEQHVFGTPRQVTVLAVSDPLTLTEAPYDLAATVDTPTLLVDGVATAMVAGRRVLLTGQDADGNTQTDVLTIASATAAGGGRTTLVATAAPAKPYLRAGAVVFGNAARATHGETVQQILGDGDGRARFPAFPLRFAPLTYVPADNPTGAQSSLTVRVNDAAWQERVSLYGADAADRAYVTRTQPDGTVVVSFGDGLHGARLPTGSNNVRATYRKGLGADGNVRPLTLSQPVDRPLGLKAATNPAAATGGVDPEAAAHARVSMPLPVRTLGRAVSLLDYADFALSFTGIAVASAIVLTLRAGRTIVVSVAGPDGSPVPANTVTRLKATLLDKGDPQVRAEVLPARNASFRLALKVRVDPGREQAVVFTAVKTALLSAYARGVRELGTPVHRSAVIATAAAVIGVQAVDLDLLYRGSVPSSQERLVADPPHVDATGQPVASELLAIADAPFDWLQEMPS
jgi:predicted phage baseplate assembly protein